MLRRHAIASLLSPAVWAKPAWAKPLNRYFEGAHGTALLVDRKSRRLLAAHSPELAAASLAPPGSTLKPLVLNELLDRGVLHATDTFPCTGALRIAGRDFACSHPPLAAPLTVRTAIAYSCNSFVAHYAARAAKGDLQAFLSRYGLDSPTHWFGTQEAVGRIWNAPPDLQALGEDGVLVTPAGLAMAYARLLERAHPAVHAGMQDAVEFGTAQRAQVAGLRVSGKTGSARASEGTFLAWFAGYTESAIVTVMLQGRSGGADAAPIGGRILEAQNRGTL
jgi:peptidoglycan glycosyltransferase